MRRAATFLLLLAAGACRPSPASGGGERPPAPVVAAPVVVADTPVYLEEIGRCVAPERVTVRPQISGRLVQVHAADGADVKAGDVLFTIDARPFQARLAAAEAQLVQARAALDLARTELARSTTLLERKALSRQDFDISKNTVEVSEARVKAAQAAVDTARLDVEYTTIRSPIEGRTGHRLVDPGNIVTANDTDLLVIQRLDPLYADFNVSEAHLPAVQRNRARGALRAEVRVPDAPEIARAGELTFVDNAVQDATGTVKLRATVPNPDRALWPGRFVRVRLVLSTIPSARLVPSEAPQLSAKGPYVYVVKEDGTAELRPVKLGQRQGERVVVEEGLQGGERVVTAGHIGVMPGGKVRVLEPASAEAK